MQVSLPDVHSLPIGEPVPVVVASMGGNPRSVEAALGLAVASWVERGQVQPLREWLTRELDPSATPWRLPVGRWVGCLAELAHARRESTTSWPEEIDARIEGFLRSTLRFSRPDGSAVFGPRTVGVGRGVLFRDLARHASDPGLATVVNWWFPAEAAEYAPPPLPADACLDRTLASLRANWSKGGDFVAVDHRERAAESRLEVYAQGRRWLGPSWSSETEQAKASSARPTLWMSNSSADLAEWTFKVAGTQVVRIALNLRGRRLALLADQVDGRLSTAAMRISLGESIAATQAAPTRSLALSEGRGRPSIRVIPIGLPCLDYPTDRGSLTAEGPAIVLRQAHVGRRCWLPLLVSWDSSRHRRPLQWRALTVSEKSKVCAPDVAFAARIRWGRDVTLVIYRSLARPALRTFLGHQTHARFLVGLFNREGVVEPIVKIEG